MGLNPFTEYLRLLALERDQAVSATKERRQKKLRHAPATESPAYEYSPSSQSEILTVDPTKLQYHQDLRIEIAKLADYFSLGNYRGISCAQGSELPRRKVQHTGKQTHADRLTPPRSPSRSSKPSVSAQSAQAIVSNPKTRHHWSDAKQTDGDSSKRKRFGDLLDKWSPERLSEVRPQTPGTNKKSIKRQRIEEPVRYSKSFRRVNSWAFVIECERIAQSRQAKALPEHGEIDTGIWRPQTMQSRSDNSQLAAPGTSMSASPFQREILRMTSMRSQSAVRRKGRFDHDRESVAGHESEMVPKQVATRDNNTDRLTARIDPPKAWSGLQTPSTSPISEARNKPKTSDDSPLDLGQHDKVRKAENAVLACLSVGDGCPSGKVQGSTPRKDAALARKIPSIALQPQIGPALAPGHAKHVKLVPKGAASNLGRDRKRIAWKFSKRADECSLERAADRQNSGQIMHDAGRFQLESVQQHQQGGADSNQSGSNSAALSSLPTSGNKRSKATVPTKIVAAVNAHPSRKVQQSLYRTDMACATELDIFSNAPSMNGDDTSQLFGNHDIFAADDMAADELTATIADAQTLLSADWVMQGAPVATAQLK